MSETGFRVAVIGGNRIPFARSNTAYTATGNQDMLTAALDGLVRRYGLSGTRVGEVVGAGLQAVNIVATLAGLLEENGGGRGLISIGAAGGQGVTAILEC